MGFLAAKSAAAAGASATFVVMPLETPIPPPSNRPLCLAQRYQRNCQHPYTARLYTPPIIGFGNRKWVGLQGRWGVNNTGRQRLGAKNDSRSTNPDGDAKFCDGQRWRSAGSCLDAKPHCVPVRRLGHWPFFRRCRDPVTDVRGGA